MLPFSRRPAPCSASHYEPLTRVLLEGVQSLKELVNVRCLPPYKFIR